MVCQKKITARKPWIQFLIGIPLLAGCGYHTNKLGDQSNASLQKGSFNYVRENVLIPYCVGCHSNQRASKKINLITYGRVMATGSVVPGRPAASKMLTEIEDGKMPPTPPGKAPRKIDPVLIEAVRTWIQQGAKP